ncbi:hypothetical protein OsI_30597 [Oryza sativa Indica Group]|uniref:Uncharacterized protein n=1 Tax=Oryza sativa subsp. indica TaxID=39946 RepID=B8BDH1_ORYSI|nr:hypothetical protein OsI_30597 [Oryza sativa Indica Group]
MEHIRGNGSEVRTGIQQAAMHEFVSQVTDWGCQRTARRWEEPINVSPDEIIHGKGMNTKNARKMSIDKDDGEAKMTMAAAAAELKVLIVRVVRGPAGQDGAHQESAWEGCVQLLSCVPKLTVTLLWLRRTVLVQSDGGEWAEREGYHHARGPEPLDAQATAIGSRTSL